MNLSCHCCHHHYHNHCHHSHPYECGCLTCPVHSLNNTNSLYKSSSSYDIFNKRNSQKMIYNSFNVNSSNSTCNTFDEANNLRSSSPSMQFDYNQELQRNNKKLNDELVRTIYEKNAADDYIRQLEQEKEMRNQKENEIDYKEMLEESVKLIKAINNVSGKENDNTKDLDYYIKHKNEYMNDIENNIKWVNDVGRISRNDGVRNEIERKYNDAYRENENKKEFLGMKGNDGNVNDGGYIYNEKVGGRGDVINDNYERNRLEKRNDNRNSGVINDMNKEMNPYEGRFDYSSNNNNFIGNNSNGFGIGNSNVLKRENEPNNNNAYNYNEFQKEEILSNATIPQNINQINKVRYLQNNNNNQSQNYEGIENPALINNKQIENNSSSHLVNLPLNNNYNNDKLRTKKRELYPKDQQQFSNEIIINNDNNASPINNEYKLKHPKLDDKTINNTNNNHNVKLPNNQNVNNTKYQTPHFIDENDTKNYDKNKPLLNSTLPFSSTSKSDNQFDFTMKNSKIKPPEEQSYLNNQINNLKGKPPQHNNSPSSFQNNLNEYQVNNIQKQQIIQDDPSNQQQSINNNNNNIPFYQEMSKNTNIPNYNEKEQLMHVKTKPKNTNNINIINQKSNPEQFNEVALPSSNLSKQQYNMYPNEYSSQNHSVYRSNSNSPDPNYINSHNKQKALRHNNSTSYGNKQSPYLNDNNYGKLKSTKEIFNDKYNNLQYKYRNNELASSPLKYNNSFTLRTRAKSRKERNHPSNNSFSGNCFACEAGCSVSNTGYSPMTFSPYNTNIRRKSVTHLKGDWKNYVKSY